MQFLTALADILCLCPGIRGSVENDPAPGLHEHKALFDRCKIYIFSDKTVLLLEGGGHNRPNALGDDQNLIVPAKDCPGIKTLLLTFSAEYFLRLGTCRRFL